MHSGSGCRVSCGGVDRGPCTHRSQEGSLYRRKQQDPGTFDIIVDERRSSHTKQKRKVVFLENTPGAILVPFTNRGAPEGGTQSKVPGGCSFHDRDGDPEKGLIKRRVYGERVPYKYNI